MPTKNPRVNVVMEDSLHYALKKLARRDGVSISSKARDLLRAALADEEDAFWAEAAADRERSFSAGKAVPHRKLWKRT